MNVELMRKGRSVRAVFSTSGTILEPPMERFGAAIGSLVLTMRKGDSVECSFDRVAHLPMVCSREIDRVIRQANKLTCTVRLTGLPADLASVFGPLAKGPDPVPSPAKAPARPKGLVRHKPSTRPDAAQVRAPAKKKSTRS
ncbi:MAG: hypothetical protein ACT4PV_14920 [Planctomycetaceae bacterium]